MAKDPPPEELAKAFLALWQAHLAACAADPLALDFRQPRHIDPRKTGSTPEKA